MMAKLNNGCSVVAQRSCQNLVDSPFPTLQCMPFCKSDQIEQMLFHRCEPFRCGREPEWVISWTTYLARNTRAQKASLFLRRPHAIFKRRALFIVRRFFNPSPPLSRGLQRVVQSMR